MDIEWIRALPVDGLLKGMPGQLTPHRQDQVGAMGWNILAEDLPFPIAVLRRDLLEANRTWMRTFVAAAGVSLCPHGKTTMSPELFALQMADGAFGITCATASQLEVFRSAGVPRVILANQLMGRANLRMALAHLHDPAFELFVLVDSLSGASALAETARDLGLQRPVNVLVEIGAERARTGVRSVAEAADLARHITQCPALRLAGLETYEGVFAGDTPEAREPAVRTLLEETAAAAAALLNVAPRSSQPFLISAGGSDFFDLVVERLRALSSDRSISIVLRGGCYLTSDSLYYRRAFERLQIRSPAAAMLPGGLRPALEVWSVVQSRPEPERAYCTVGKRDISYDFELPCAIATYRRGRDVQPQPAPAEWRVLKLNDQHLHLEIPPDADLQIGDLVAFGVSHPCTTFDKWRLLLVVDDAYDVVDAVRTFF